jgi:hypothetical protein
MRINLVLNLEAIYTYFCYYEKKDPRLEKAGVSGYNKPKRTSNHPTKSHVVVAKVGDKVKTIRFGQQGVSGAGKSPKTEAQKARRKSFKARHAKNIAKGVCQQLIGRMKVSGEKLCLYNVVLQQILSLKTLDNS